MLFYLSQLSKVRPLVHVPGPALGDDLVEVGVAVGGPLEAVAVADAPHHLARAHPRIRSGACAQVETDMCVIPSNLSLALYAN